MLKSVQIQNFRGHQNTLVDFQKVTTLVGENGTGKTSILEAINFAMSPSFLSGRIDEQDFNNEDIDSIDICLWFDPFKVTLQDGFQTRDINCDQIRLRVSRRQKAAANKALSDPFVTTRYYVPVDSVTAEGDEKWVIMRESGNPFRFTPRHLMNPVSVEGLPRAFYFDKNRSVQIDVSYNTTFKKITEEFNWRFRKSIEDEDFKAEILQKWDDLYDRCLHGVEAKKIKETVDAIKEKMNAISENSFDKLELSLINLERPFSKSFFSLRDGLNQIHHSGMGSGISMVLSLIVLETISSLAKEDIIFLIDEPEIHLHPQLQKFVFSYLIGTEQQIITSTHSDCMINLGDWRSIRRLGDFGRVLPDQTTLETAPGDQFDGKTTEEHLDEIAQYFQDKTVFFRENNEILFAKRCLLTEGPAEKFGLESLAKKCGIELGNLTIVACNGKTKIRYYQLLCKAFGIPYFTLFDLDNKPVEESGNAEIVDWCLNDHYYAFKSCFESLFGTKNSDHKSSDTLRRIESLQTESIPSEIHKLFELLTKFMKTT